MIVEEFVANYLYLITFKLFSLSYTCSPGAKLCNGSFLSIDILVKKEKKLILGTKKYKMNQLIKIKEKISIRFSINRDFNTLENKFWYFKISIEFYKLIFFQQFSCPLILAYCIRNSNICVFFIAILGVGNSRQIKLIDKCQLCLYGYKHIHKRANSDPCWHLPKPFTAKYCTR